MMIDGVNHWEPVMQWLVVQTDLIAPTSEQLVAAYEAVPSLVAGDAKRTARYSFGVLAENLPTDEAGNLVAALVKQGVPAAAINPADLPMLGQPMRQRRLECTDLELLMQDAMQRVSHVTWDHVDLVTVGDVATTSTRITTDVKRVAHGRYVHHQVVPHTEIIGSNRVLLEVIAEGGQKRFQFEEEHMLFQHLKGRRLVNRRGNFVQTVLDLLAHAPRAVVNRGAAGLAEHPRRIQQYVNQVMFERENRWHLWWSRQGH